MECAKCMVTIDIKGLLCRACAGRAFQLQCNDCWNISMQLDDAGVIGCSKHLYQYRLFGLVAPYHPDSESSDESYSLY